MSSGPADGASAASDAVRLVGRNTLALVLSQFITMPLSLLLNILMGRWLGAQEFGTFFLLQTIASFAFLVVEWGHPTALTGAIARAPGRSGLLLGSSVAVRLPLALVAWAVCAVGLQLDGTNRGLQLALALTFGNALPMSVAFSLGSAIRGREQLGVAAWVQVAIAVIGVALPLGAMALGARLLGVLWTNLVVALFVLALSVMTWRRVDKAALKASGAVARELFREGTPFVALSAILALQPLLDTVILSRLAPVEVVGWHAAARKVLGFLIFPSTTLGAALYPTLCRLHARSQGEWAAMTRTGLKAVALFSVPAALGCALFAEAAVALFNREAFGPVADNVRVLSPYVFLVFFNIVVGTALAAAGSQKRWVWAQSACVLVSLVADPVLVPLFQRRWGNGGIGVGLAGVVSEMLMIVAAAFVVPRGVLDRGFWRTLVRAGAAGGLMVGAAFACRPLHWSAGMVISLAAYALGLAGFGAVDRDQRKLISDALIAKLRPRRGSRAAAGGPAATDRGQLPPA